MPGRVVSPMDCYFIGSSAGNALQLSCNIFEGRIFMIPHARSLDVQHSYALRNSIIICLNAGVPPCIVSDKDINHYFL